MIVTKHVLHLVDFCIFIHGMMHAIVCPVGSERISLSLERCGHETASRVVIFHIAQKLTAFHMLVSCAPLVECVYYCLQECISLAGEIGRAVAEASMSDQARGEELALRVCAQTTC